MSTSDGRSPIPASHILGRKLDSIPFSAHHMMVILVLGTVGFVEGYDVALSGSLLVLARSRYSWPVGRFAGWRLPQSSS